MEELTKREGMGLRGGEKMGDMNPHPTPSRRFAR